MQTIDEYIASFPVEVQKLLQDMRKTIQKAAPTATEAMKYGIPTFVLDSNLVHFAGYKNHIGFYPTPDGIVAFKKELEGYKQSKGAVQFPLHQRLPLKLVAQIVKYRAEKVKSQK